MKYSRCGLSSTKQRGVINSFYIPVHAFVTITQKAHCSYSAWHPHCLLGPFSRAASQTIAFQPARGLSSVGESFCLLLIELYEVPVDSVLKLVQVCLDKPLGESSDFSNQPFPLTLCRVRNLFCVTMEVTDDDAEHYGPQH